ncbi:MULTISPECIES: class I SAM-dependent methyltransferase [Streptomyces]|uniref:class I SAM-dependent methyltransferase n=1 Tax=Streptomyces TaxID=1883 RepID=UPI001F3543FF|nr:MULTISPECIES: L-histidine N(alpha)-methyltransferase [Streptomyces]MCM9078283.1 L-histidine N(alpha)-methyltransferase [Streptomyces spororaveus]MCX5307300.1 L-histidine N(alpha)-methyltransferase [Streptomyces sp. NBC_00160]
MESTAFAAAVEGGTSGTLPVGSFYRDGGAPAIMRAAHFPDELLSYLQMEGLAALESATRHRCDSLVEHGCYDGRALEVARAAGLPYLGIDISPGAIAALAHRVGAEGLNGQARALVGDILHNGSWVTEVVGRRPLQLLPFNLLGNFAEPEKVLASIAAVGGVGVISVFNEQPWTHEVRRAYYTACGIERLDETAGEYGGVVFRGDGGFASQSFSEEGLLRLLGTVDATVLNRTGNRLGQCVTVRLGSRLDTDPED